MPRKRSSERAFQLDWMLQMKPAELSRRQDMNIQPVHYKTYWFFSLVALLVALGTQSLLGVLIPARAATWLIGAPTTPNIIFIAGITNFWPLATAIRMASFVVGGFVGTLVAGKASARIVALTAFVSLTYAIFEEVEAPDIQSLFKVYIWIFAAPVGICLGAVIARFIGRDA